MITYLTLGDGDFTYSLDLARYLISNSKHNNHHHHHHNNNSNNLYSYSDANTKETRTIIQLIATGIDSFDTLQTKYKDTPHILKQLKSYHGTTTTSTTTTTAMTTTTLHPTKSILQVYVHHNINAIITKTPTTIIIDNNNNQQDTNDIGTLVKRQPLPTLSVSLPSQSIGNVTAADYVLFHHPHLGTEDAILHARFMCHLFHSMTHHWMKRPHGIVAITLVQGQYERWKVHDAATRNQLVLLSRRPFQPPPLYHHPVITTTVLPNDDSTTTRTTTTKTTTTTRTTTTTTTANQSIYHYRRHQTGKSFETRRMGRSSETFTFGRRGERPIAYCLEWQQQQQPQQQQQQCHGQERQQQQQDQNDTTDTGDGTGTVLPPTTVGMDGSIQLLECPFCDKTFREERSRKCHLRDKHSTKPDTSDGKARTSPSFACEACRSENGGGPRYFVSAQALQDHERAKHSGLHSHILPDWCRNAQTAGNEGQEGRDEETSNHGFCAICGMIYKDESHASRHLLEFIPKDYNEPFLCCFCRKPFREKRAKLQHENFCSPQITTKT